MTKATENYQDLSVKLDTILQALQTPDLNIDEAIELYKQGQKVIKELEIYLKTAENTIRKLSRTSAADE